MTALGSRRTGQERFTQSESSPQPGEFGWGIRLNEEHMLTSTDDELMVNEETWRAWVQKGARQQQAVNREMKVLAESRSHLRSDPRSTCLQQGSILFVLAGKYFHLNNGSTSPRTVGVGYR